MEVERLSPFPCPQPVLSASLELGSALGRGVLTQLIQELDQHPKGIYFSAEGKWLQL